MQSELFTGNSDLDNILAGTQTMQDGDSGEAVTLVQTALLILGFELPTTGADGSFANDTPPAVVAYKTDRGIGGRPPNDTVDRDTLSALDSEIAVLEGNAEVTNPPHPVSNDWYTFSAAGGLLGIDVEQIIRDQLQLNPNELCFPISELVNPASAQMFGYIAETAIANNYCSSLGGCALATDWLDVEGWLIGYVDFLNTHHPGLSLPKKLLLATSRPDILSDRPPTQEFYEIKPESLPGITKGLTKMKALQTLYPSLGLPYVAGTTYMPPTHIPLAAFTVGGLNLDVQLGVRRLTPGLVTYRMCLEGDLATMLQTVRLAALVVAILIALRAILPAPDLNPSPGVTPVLA